MNVELSEHVQALIQQQLASGEFSTPADVIERAVELLAGLPLQTIQPIDPQTGQVFGDMELRAEIQKGLDDIDAGRVAPLDVDDIRRRGRQRHTATRQAAD